MGEEENFGVNCFLIGMFKLFWAGFKWTLCIITGHRVEHCSLQQTQIELHSVQGVCPWVRERGSWHAADLSGKFHRKVWHSRPSAPAVQVLHNCLPSLPWPDPRTRSETETERVREAHEVWVIKEGSVRWTPEGISVERQVRTHSHNFPLLVTFISAQSTLFYFST